MPASDRSPNEILRVATFNVLTPREAAWPERQPVIARAMASLDVDLVALQEVDAGIDREADLAALLGHGWDTAWHRHTTPDGIGLVVASRWPLIDVCEHSLHVTARTGDAPWSAVVMARVLAPHPIGPFWVAHHKPVFELDHEHERELQAVSAARFIDSVAAESDRVVLLGDFDAAPDSSSVRFWTGRQSLHGVSTGYYDVWAAVHPDDPGYTFTPSNPLMAAGPMGWSPARRIDYVMVRGDAMGPTLRPSRAERICVEPDDSVQASDHFGVYAELGID